MSNINPVSFKGRSNEFVFKSKNYAQNSIATSNSHRLQAGERSAGKLTIYKHRGLVSATDFFAFYFCNALQG